MFIVAYRAGARCGRSLPLTVAVCLELVACLSLTQGGSVVLYAGGSAALTIVVLFLIPALRGLTAQADPSGRLAAAAGAAVGVGGVVAPIAGGGLLLAGAGYRGVGWFAAFGFALALAILRPAVRRLAER